jgi:hypothetical protein
VVVGDFKGEVGKKGETREDSILVNYKLGSIKREKVKEGEKF